MLSVSENGNTVLDSNAVTRELLEEQSLHLLTREYIDLIGSRRSFLLHSCLNRTVWKWFILPGESIQSDSLHW